MEQCKTLGEETFFEYSFSNHQLIIKYGFTTDKQTTIEIPNSLISTVIDRVNYLKSNNIENYRKVSFYSKTNWKECPQTQYCPYIAKLILDVFPIKTLNELIHTT